MNSLFRYMAEEIHITPELENHIQRILDHPLGSDDDYQRLGGLCEDESETVNEMYLKP
ncbi:MAG: hypothetical protein WBD16_04265 [Pyrinomonadaceae bacterium]